MRPYTGLQPIFYAGTGHDPIQLMPINADHGPRHYSVIWQSRMSIIEHLHVDIYTQMDEILERTYLELTYCMCLQ